MFVYVAAAILSCLFMLSVLENERNSIDILSIVIFLFLRYNVENLVLLFVRI